MADDCKSRDLLVCFADLVACLTGILVAHGCSMGVAGIIAGNCASAERDGSIGHGLYRLQGYVSTLDSGWVDGQAEPEIAQVAAGFLRIDAKNGFAQPALALAADQLIAMAGENSIAVAALRNSHHLAALSLDVEPFARRGLIALSFINSMAVVVPSGARKPVFGTNPIAFASPRSGMDPLVIDFATSSMAHGEVSVAAQEGRMLPDNVGVDRSGEPTNDPAAILNGGALLPFGGHKGSAISMMVEILCAALVGGRFSYEVDWSSHHGAKTPNTGQSLILIDPYKGTTGLPDFGHRVVELIERLNEAGQERIPGDRRLAIRKDRVTNGIPISDENAKIISALGGSLRFKKTPEQQTQQRYRDSVSGET